MSENSSVSSTLKIILAVIGVLGTIAVALIQYQPWKSDEKKQTNKLVIAGRVVERDSNNPIHNAEITLGGRTERYITEDNGNFRLTITSNSKVDRVRIRVEKKGYFPVDRSITPPAENLIILLEKKDE